MWPVLNKLFKNGSSLPFSVYLNTKQTPAYMKLHLRVFILFILLFPKLNFAQKPVKPDAAQLFEEIQKLNFLGTALYVAAHPDDENTAFISYLSNGVHARTGYLALTRGDGGQNLVGPELREELGVIRTQELLAARRIDGGEQFFSRANDFGYSKNPEETLNIWNKQKVLSDVVWRIRKFRPDIIINRFDHRTPGTTHGHHTASAMLSVEAFDQAGDPTKFPDQLEYTQIWQPKRQFFNTSWWFYGSREKFEKADKSNLVSVDDGQYYPLLGLSNTEISAMSRSQHRSQGFGNTGSRGKQREYLELLKGDLPPDGNLFDGIDTSWNRVEDGKAIGKILNAVEKNFDFNDPSASLPSLLKAYPLVAKIKDDYWASLKLKELTEIIQHCAGLYLEAATSSQTATADQDLDINLEAINRSAVPAELVSVNIEPVNKEITLNKKLADNADFEQKTAINTGDANLTTPYWLQEPGTMGMYHVENQKLIGLPETPHTFKAVFKIRLNGVEIPFTVSLTYKYNDRVEGEVYEPFEIVPAVTSSIATPVIVFAKAEKQPVKVKVTANKQNINASVRLNYPEGWTVSPKTQDINLAKKGESQTVSFNVMPPSETSQGQLSPVVSYNGENYDKKLERIDYEHIPLQTLSLNNAVQVVRINIKKEGENIGYINGAGDAIPASLEQIGYHITPIDIETASPALLNRFDAIVMGIRAYNTVGALRYKQPVLLDYVKQGGTLLVQYNTARGFDFPNIGPYPLNLSSDRVTDENAEVQILDPNAEILNTPNKISPEDFKGWVQERGLYFPNNWDAHYKPVISINDKGEQPMEGSLLITKYGKGHYIYTGLSFFRELPAGVPGAYRLFANLLSVGKNKENDN